MAAIHKKKQGHFDANRLRRIHKERGKKRDKHRKERERNRETNKDRKRKKIYIDRVPYFH